MLGDTRIGISICEDIWHPKGPILEHANQGAKLTININGSPYHAGKKKVRENLLKSQSSNHKLFVGYINMVGGQDELVFDGNSMLFNPDGEIIAQANQFEEDLVFTDLKIDPLGASTVNVLKVPPSTGLSGFIKHLNATLKAEIV